MAASGSNDVPPLGKYLASTDKKTRDKAIKSLTVFLSDPSHDDLPKAELSKLWKGIFYCFWMSDKPLVQQALASEIAEILLKIPKTSAALAFLRGFWESMVREWNGIDRLRIDKYYMLVRRFVNASFRLLLNAEWDNDMCAEYNSILTSKGGPLCPEDTRIPLGLGYHLSDIYLEELDKILAAAEEPHPAPLATLISPFLTFAARTPTNTAYTRIQSSLLEPLISAFPASDAGSDEGNEDPGDEDDRSRKRQRMSDPDFQHVVAHSCVADSRKEGTMKPTEVKKALLKRLFNIAGEESTRDSNRRKLYALWKSYADEDDEEDR